MHLIGHVQKITNPAINLVGLGYSTVTCATLQAAKVPSTEVLCKAPENTANSMVALWVVYLVGDSQASFSSKTPGTVGQAPAQPLSNSLPPAPLHPTVHQPQIQPMVQPKAHSQPMDHPQTQPLTTPQTPVQPQPTTATLTPPTQVPKQPVSKSLPTASQSP